MLKTFVIDLGYVESSRLARFTMTHDHGFDNVIEAMKDIRKILVEIVSGHSFDLDKETPRQSCCQNALEQNPAANYCSTCGDNLLKPVKKEESAYYGLAADLFDDMLSMDIDAAADICNHFEEHGWGFYEEDPGKQDPSRAFVWGVMGWIIRESYLEWYIQDKGFSNRE